MTATAPSYRFCIYGSRGIAEISTPALDRLGFTPAPEKPSGPGGKRAEAEHLDGPGTDTVRLELEAFADAVAGRAPYPIGQNEMIHGASVFEAITVSSRDRQLVPVR